MLEGVSEGDVVDQQSSGRASVVRASDGAEALLARRVPDLKIDLILIDRNHSGAELYTYNE